MKPNVISIVGNLGSDPELRYTQNGTAVCSFSIAVSEKFGERDETTWFDVTAWRDLAENITESCPKGTRLVVVGRMQKREWTTNEGEKRSKYEVVAEHVGADLQWATAKIERNQRG